MEGTQLWYSSMNRFEIKRYGEDVTFKLNKRAGLVVGMHNKALSVVAMRVNNPDRSFLRING
jgi:hypothetical protein